jgi:SAM-dependent methyltransferase
VTEQLPIAGPYLNPAFAWPEETSVAFATRLRFIGGILERVQAKRVLDVGCGTGEQLTGWLAQLCPRCQFLGIDPDAATIAHAQQQFAAVPNLAFATQWPAPGHYDVVIASEVLEHVAQPSEFLEQLHAQVAPDGLLILTTPNGYGCSEWMALAETLLTLSGIWPLVRRLKRWLFRQGTAPVPAESDTRAVSPHVNFFSLRRLRRLFAEHNLKIVGYQGRMFLHHFLCTMLIDRSRSLARLNARLGAILPAWMVSDWMFVLQSAGPAKRGRPYRRTIYERMKRYFNLKRFGLAG